MRWDRLVADARRRALSRCRDIAPSGLLNLASWRHLPAMRKVLLVILDGWGHSDFEGTPTVGNAVELARVPTFRRLFDERPRTRLACSGGDVGLPAGQMGNSEVGHLNLGAGR